MIDHKIEMAVTLKDFIKLGGKPIRGMKFKYKVVDVEKEYTFLELTKDGVKVEEVDFFIGTISLYLNVELTMFSNLQLAFNAGRNSENKDYLDWRRNEILKVNEIN